MAKHCFNNLFATAISANFLLLPLLTIRSYTSRHALLCLQALKAQRNNKLRSFLLPTLLILLRPRTLLPDSLIVGVIPTCLQSCAPVSNLEKPSVITIKNKAVLAPIPGTVCRRVSCCCCSCFTNSSRRSSIPASSLSKCFLSRFKDQYTNFEGIPKVSSPCILFLVAVRFLR